MIVPSPTLYRAPVSVAGTSAGTAAVTMHLLGAGHQAGQPVPAARVQLGEHVVQDQHRVLAVRAQQFVGGQPQGQRQRPGLAVAGVPAGGQLPDPQLELVAVRPDQAHPAFQLLRAGLLQRLPHGRLQVSGLLLAVRLGRPGPPHRAAGTTAGS